MKRFLTIMTASALVALAIAIPVYAAVDDTKCSFSAVAATTNSVTYNCHGNLVGVGVDFSTTQTGMVYVLNEYGTILFSNTTIAADALYLPSVQLQTTAGGALSWTELGTINSVAATNAVTTTFFTKPFPLAGDITVTLVGKEAARTNTAIIKLLIEK